MGSGAATVTRIGRSCPRAYQGPSGQASAVLRSARSRRPSAERDKINYLNGYVRGGLINLREKRRLPIRLAVTYGAVDGPATTFTKDLNEEGVFLFTDKPLPEASQVHMLLTLPGRPQPLSLV